MSCTCRTLVRPQQPSFQQRSYPVNTWHHDVGWFRTGRQDSLLANIAPLGEVIVSFPAVGVHNRARLNGSPHELYQAFRGNVWNVSQSNSSEPIRCVDLHGDRYDGLLLGLSATCTFFKTSDIGLIDLHKTVEFFATRPNHRPSHLVEPRPCRLIAAKPQDPLKSQRTGTKLLISYMPHRTEPQTKGFRGPLKNCTGGWRSLTLTSRTPKLASTCRPRLLSATPGASKPITPSQTTQVLETCLFGREPLLKLNQRAGVINTWHRMPTFCSHPPNITLRERSG